MTSPAGDRRRAWSPRTRRPGVRRGMPIWLLLTCIALVPLMAALTLAGVYVQRATDDVHTAEQTTAAVRTTGLTALAAAAIHRESVPVLTAAALTSPEASAELGMTPTYAALVQRRLVALLRDAQADTDQALDALSADGRTLEVTQVAARLSVLREMVVQGSLDPDQIETLREGYVSLSNDLGAARAEAVLAALQTGLSSPTLAAITDVSLLSRYTEALGSDMARFVDWMLVPSDGLVVTRERTWRRVHVEVSSLRARFGTISDLDHRRVAFGLSAGEDSAVVDQILDAAARSVSRPQLTVELIEQLAQHGGRQIDAAADLLASMTDLAITRSHADGSAAANERVQVVAASLVAVALVALLTLSVGRSINSSLRNLARAADRISRGQLGGIPDEGPREVRTVATALSGTVASLRRIQDQAGAVARGDLSDPVLDEALPGPLGEVVHASVQQIVSSVRHRDRLQDALAHQATHDALTQLPNRAHALDLVDAALRQACDTQRGAGLLFVDLDGFKAVNDRCGHAAGDTVLQTVAARLSHTVRAGDIVCRLGGDEFVVVVDEGADEADLVALGERLIAAASEPVAVCVTGVVTSVAVGASVGVGRAEPGDLDGPGLFARADTAVYRAKAAGRGRVEVHRDEPDRSPGAPPTDDAGLMPTPG